MDLRISVKRALSMSSLLSGLIEDISVHCLDTSDLSRSIKQKGLLHPLIVRYAKREGHYQIITGNRRYIACKSLGWRKIPCQIIELNSDKEAFEISLIENIQRRTLNPIEEAHAFKMYVTDFGWGGVSDLASKIGKSASYVDRRLQLLELPKDVLEKVDDSELNVTAAEELIPIHDEIKQSKLAGIISRKRLSVKDVRNLIQENQNSVYAVDSNDALMQTEVKDLAELDRRVQRSLDKSIVVFRMAMNKMLDIMQGIEDNWVIYEILLQHRNVLNAQIDLLIKQKKKIYESRF
jgi:ParB family chromosome partitioning protein